MAGNHGTQIETLLSALGIVPESFERLLAWSLDEHLCQLLVHDQRLPDSTFSSKDGLLQFRRFLEDRTGRQWGIDDLNALFDRVKAGRTKHFRKPITYETYLRLLWRAPLKCALCGLAPPEVRLHIDHVFPASRGGSSDVANLQFLCESDNLRKGAKLEVGEPWLNLR